jgi:uncharacterized protein YpmS
MSWWIAAALVWLAAGVITAIVIGQVARRLAPDLRSQVEWLERENQELRGQVTTADRRARLAQVMAAELRAAVVDLGGEAEARGQVLILDGPRPASLPDLST